MKRQVRRTLTVSLALAAMMFAVVPFVLAADAPASAPSPRPAAPPPPPPPPPPAASGPEHVQVQHILIGFTGSVPRKDIKRSQEEAKALAEDLLGRAKKGVDFGALVEKYTDDAAPGLYGMSNTSVAPASGEMARGRMVPGFGDVSFSLKVGEIGMAEYDKARSPFGWHIIKRVK